MKKTLCCLFALLLVLSAVFAFAACKKDEPSTPSGNEADAASDLAYITDKGTLVVGITEYEPMDYLDENGDWTGFDAEYATAVAGKLGVKVEFIEIDWDNKVNELNSKAIDCIWNGMTILDDLKTAMDITDAYVINAQVVVMKADKLADYPDVESMKDLTFAVEAGSAGAGVAADNGLNTTEVNVQADALTEVASGAADACIIDITMANAMTGEGTSYADLAAGISLSEEEYGVGVRLGSDLCAKINEITDELIADGTLTALAEKYELTLVG
ncbi:MAG: transporter substrate-binding domain-containing protein [Clostridia bacterium]|nr:transporter substrate-binding domain-containing protein [Clostridia bacterium]